MKALKIVKLDPSRWEEYKNLRLEALQNAPTAFASSYEEEIDAPDEKWRERLTGKNDAFYLFAEVDLGVNIKNESALKLYQSLGFEIVGTLKKELFINDEYFDEYEMEKILK